MWQEFVKTGMVKGFSIEGYFTEKSKKEELSREIEAGIELLKIKQMILENKFREDFYHRLNVVPLNLPTLQSRTEDIPLLIEYFIS